MATLNSCMQTEQITVTCLNARGVVIRGNIPAETGNSRHRSGFCRKFKQKFYLGMKHTRHKVCTTVHSHCCTWSDWSDPSLGSGIFRVAVLFICT